MSRVMPAMNTLRFVKRDLSRAVGPLICKDVRRRRAKILGLTGLDNDEGFLGQPFTLLKRGEGSRCQPWPYGGSMNARWAGATSADRAGKWAASSFRTPPIRECEGGQVIFNTLFADCARSMNIHAAAPRESASRPSAPEPANKSMTRASSSWNPIPWRKILNSDSRVRSEVGRVSRPEGANSLRPLQSPPTMRTGPVLHGIEPQLLAEHLFV